MKYHESTELCHHGIKGQKWGIRRFQNKDGTRTAAGKAREKEQRKHLEGRKYYNTNKFDGAGSIPKMEDVDILFPEEVPKSLKDAFGDLDNSPLKSSYENDCVNVFLAYEGRCRGLDVIPGHQSDFSTIMFDEVTNCFKPTDNEQHFFKDEKIDSLQGAKDLLSKYPDGSRGYISGRFELKDGVHNHAICWSKDEGIVSFGDGVNGLTAENYFHVVDADEPVKYFRSDDMDLNWRAYLQYVDQP